MPFKGSFVAVYTAFVNNYIETCVANGTKDETMRRAVERRIMEVVDKANLPLNIKLAWYGSVILYDIFSAYWARKQHEHKLAKKQIMRYWPNYNLIWEIDQCELNYQGGDSEGGEDLKSSRESAGANNTTKSTKTHGNSLHVNDGSNSESSTGGDEDETPTSSPASTAAKTSKLAPTSLAEEVRSAKATTNKNEGPMAKRAGIRKTAPKGILKKASAYKKNET